MFKLDHIVASFWHTLLEMAPYLLLGFLVAGILSVFISAEWVERHLGKGRWLPIVKASLFGVPLPLCSCGVIPVAASLRKQGANRGATISFLISTPQTGVDSIAVTYSLLGKTFALFRPIAAFVAGVYGGGVVAQFDKESEQPNPVGEEKKACCGCGPRRSKWSQAMHHGFVVLPRDIAGSLLLGLLAAGIISAFVPENYFAGGLGSGWSAKGIMLLLGIPLYVCATSTVPVAAALIATGISPGAALVFLMTGPATNAATIVTIWNVLGKRTAVLYLGVVAASALLAGEVMDRIYTHTGDVAGPGAHWMIPGWAKVILAVALLAVLLVARYRKVHPEQTSS